MRCKVKIDNQTYQVELGDLHDRPIVALVDGVRIEVWPDEHRDHSTIANAVSTNQMDRESAEPPDASRPLVPTFGRSANTPEIRAPLPGVIKDVLVKPGEEISYGQELCVIEAMKMKNIIRSTRAGRLAEISVFPGQTVNHGDTLMTFTE